MSIVSALTPSAAKTMPAKNSNLFITVMANTRATEGSAQAETNGDAKRVRPADDYWKGIQPSTWFLASSFFLYEDNVPFSCSHRLWLPELSLSALVEDKLLVSSDWLLDSDNGGGVSSESSPVPWDLLSPKVACSFTFSVSKPVAIVSIHRISLQICSQSS